MLRGEESSFPDSKHVAARTSVPPSPTAAGRRMPRRDDWEVAIERDIGVGVAIVAAVFVGFTLLLLAAGPGWVLDLPAVALVVLVVASAVAFFLTAYRRRLVI